MSTAAFAATITITDTGKNIEVDNHRFEAYQIFSGTLSSDGTKLSDIVWGAGVDGSGLLAALKASADTALKKEGTNIFASANSAEDVAKALEGAQNGGDLMVAFSRIVADHTTTAQKSVTGGTINDLDNGYYLVKDVTPMVAETENALSAFIVYLVGSAEVNIKTDAPHIEKQLKNDEESDDAYRDANNVAIGDTIDYKITSTVPNMSNYKQYYFIVHDTLSKGLSFNNDLAITVGNSTVYPKGGESNPEGAATYELTTTGSSSAATGTTLEIVFNNFKQFTAGQAVTITYSANLTSDAKVGVEGNPNEVYLEYSNNPNEEGDGTDKPDDDDNVTGTTPKDYVITYTTNLKIKKVDGNGDALQGVTFEISGYAENQKATYTETYEKADDGNYWLLADGKYTTVAPTTLTAGKYNQTVGAGKKDANTYQKYKLVVKRADVVQTVKYPVTDVTTPANGEIDLGEKLASGSLPAGTYVIHEKSTVSGYNILDHDIIVKVTGKIGDNLDTAATITDIATNITWSKDSAEATLKDDGTIEIEVVNKSGAVLPSTGGIGTTIFYVIGAILVLGAGIVLVSKRRMSAN